MKKEIHPKYQQVIFRDSSSDFEILAGSTLTSDEEAKWKDGKTYPLIKVEVSSGSHPFYTGRQRVAEKGGRIERFRAKVTHSQEVATQTKPKKVTVREIAPKLSKALKAKMSTKKVSSAPKAKKEGDAAKKKKKK
jgi:large subunit ribosomal protein L31